MCVRWLVRVCVCFDVLSYWCERGGEEDLLVSIVPVTSDPQ